MTLHLAINVVLAIVFLTVCALVGLGIVQLFDMVGRQPDRVVTIIDYEMPEPAPLTPAQLAHPARQHEPELDDPYTHLPILIGSHDDGSTIWACPECSWEAIHSPVGWVTIANGDEYVRHPMRNAP